MDEALLALAVSRPADALAQAGQVLAQRPDPTAASVAHQARAIVLRDSGRVDEAVAELRAALRAALRSPSAERAVDVRATLGVTLGFAGRTAQGLAMLDTAVAGCAGGVHAGRVLMRRASLLRVLGRYDEALADLRRAIDLLRRGGDPIWEARSRTHRFLVYAALGQAARADRDLAAAERLLAGAGQEMESAMAVHNRADLALQGGDIPRALGFLDEAAERYAALGVNRPNLAIDRCGVLLAAGLAAEAVAVADEAVRRAGTGGERTKVAELLLAAARAALAAGRSAEASTRAADARDLFRRQGRPWWQARAAFVVTQSRYAAGERGARLLGQAVDLAHRLDALRAEEAPAAHLLAGRVAAGLGRAADAERHLASAARFRHRGPTFGHAAGWLAQALRAQGRGDTRAALLACRRGLVAAGEHQRTLGAPELRAHAAAYGTELVAIALRHAVQRGDARMLLRWTERWRASALAVPPALPPDDPELVAELGSLRAVVRRLESARAEGGPTARLDHERALLEASIRARTRRAAGDPDGGGFAGTDLAALLDGLGRHRLAELTAVDGVLYATTVVGRRVRMHAVGPVAEAEREVELARFMLRRLAHGRAPRGALDRLDRAGVALQRALLGPAAADLAGDGPVVVVPPAQLHAVPWALLPALRGTPVGVAPSAATWLRAGAVPAPRRHRVALVGGPGLDASAVELKQLAALYPDAAVLSDGAATAAATLAALDGAWTAHVAAHGTFHAENPLFSALSLDDGPLMVHDLGRLRRAPQRLVLSSCESGVAGAITASAITAGTVTAASVAVGTITAGTGAASSVAAGTGAAGTGAAAGAAVVDELLGMVTALVPLGTASILASVVPVHDGATAPLMVAFHERLRAGASFAEALLAVRSAGEGDPVAVATALSFLALGR
ncbi:CHAT domain-containing protein [Phytohabitans sp. ZYX-F-186]|uniref:CHAT domain-containing protein n=1 Tax=Phytohabitans maris TaxID=3071409 RepID=A0ABU0ZQJ8_9ACTN|nr:CHAT domain-containing protein [Phytohabitans sp. ZYX-F-186]MDQ7909300.1 CHAT domain-containing protein [Phytohabitans sp. ZYX-F-186]